ncbi:transcriptional regulator, LysR family (plasmid) [Paracoccus aminophilus JCM 7686]|uniref:Transcriptional regulator, LysR family n=1 Tax=Paracoccus aminophilus JCM 7686 TaxID=1367847 RepID=S5YHI1_PARAH|nr:transcriptional regulator, LysR family [Paracoccus aminophilus JCM 7686]
MLKAGQLVQVLPDYAGQTRPLHLLSLAGRAPTAKLRSVIKATVAEFGGLPAREA